MVDHFVNGKKYIAELLVVLLAITNSCTQVTRLDSDQINSSSERIKILREQIHCFSEISDAEFEFFNVNGFNNQLSPIIPGASSADYKLALKVDSKNISKWTRGMEIVEAENDDYHWINQIVSHRAQQWDTHGKPIFYKSPGERTVVIAFPQSGILFKRIIIL